MLNASSFRRSWKSLSIVALAVSLSTYSFAEEATMASQEMLSQTCVGCHGAKGHSHGPASPSIGGQDKAYLVAVLLGYKYNNNPSELNKALKDPMFKSEEYEDMEVFPRYGTIMPRLMKGYTVKEIISMAKYFSDTDWENADQAAQSKPMKARAATGKKLHKKFCEKCHEDGGTMGDDGSGILAGQWAPYLRFTLNDYMKGHSKMPKKMKSKMEKMLEEYGEASAEEIINFYADQK
ncbi:MAG: c-type cytochrome [Candidatus Oxydemutatoraceae bacterium WSBS_2016_MAG_OTU14]